MSIRDKCFQLITSLLNENSNWEFKEVLKNTANKTWIRLNFDSNEI